MARRDKAAERQIARGRIRRLLRLAREATREDKHGDAQRYGELAWALKNSYLVPDVPDLKQQVCRACKGYLLPGQTARTRMTDGKVTTTCLHCGSTRRQPLVKERKLQRQAP